MITFVGPAVTRAVAAGTTTTDPTGESVKSGPLGLVVIIVLCIGCYFLFKSMSKHLRRVREEFPTRLPGDPPPSESRADMAVTNQATTESDERRAPTVGPDRSAGAAGAAGAGAAGAADAADA